MDVLWTESQSELFYIETKKYNAYIVKKNVAYKS